MGKIVRTIVSLFVLFCAKHYYDFWQVRPLPELGTLFYSVNRSLPIRHELKIGDADTLSVSAEHPLFVIIHGYTESSFRKWIEDLSQALLAEHPSSFVLLVDHYHLLHFSRPMMNRNIDWAARDTAHMLHALTKGKGMSHVHVIGFSLGCRIAGGIDAHLNGSAKIGRITGIDPSFPWYGSENPRDFLDGSDADLVVAIRTSRVSWESPGVHVDFVVNGGELQPGCNVWWWMDLGRTICSHNRAPHLFFEAVTNESTKTLVACGCPDWQVFASGKCQCQKKNTFGLRTDPSSKGNFFLKTGASQPYSVSVL